jgi:anaerobic selenocysteine-containing dehydrogenase
MTTIVKRTACYGCPVFACFIKVYIEDGKIVKVERDAERPGVECRRGFLDNGGRAMIEYHYSPLRLNYPLKRVGERGANKWQRISWDQALDEIAAKLKELKEKYGPHCVAVMTGTAHHSDNNWLPWRFHVAFGSVNHMGHEQVCYGVNVVTQEFTFGWPVSFVYLFRVPKCCVLAGTNVSEAIFPIWEAVKEFKKKGMKLVVVDARLTEAARIADMWLQVRPGSDIALWLSWIHLIMKEGWYDREFVENWSNAPFLVRTDTNKILRANEVFKGESADSFVVWNTVTNAPAVWVAWPLNQRGYKDKEVKPALSGTYTIQLVDGTKVQCKTVWDMLWERVKDWTPERAAEITWVDKDKIVDACKMYATFAPGGTSGYPILIPAGHLYDSYAPGSTDVYRSCWILRILCGSVERTELLSGMYDPKKCVPIYEMELRPDEAFTPEEKSKQIGADRFRALGFPGFDLKTKYEKMFWPAPTNAMWSCQPHPPTIWRDILAEKPNRIRAVIMSGANPLLKYANSKLVYEAMKKLDLIVALEFVMTPSALLADYVLPMADWLERPEIGPSTPADMFNVIHVSGAVVKPEYERRTDYDFFRGIAVRLGLEKFFPWKDLEECYNWRLRGLLEAYGCKDINEFAEKVGYEYPPQEPEKFKRMNGFATPTGKTEIWSVALETLGYDPLPHFVEPAYSNPRNYPLLSKQYPYILITQNRHLPNYHTMYFEVPSLRKMCPDPIVEIHPDTARKANPPIADGDWVWVETRMGRIRMKARLTTGIHPSVINVQHHWWFPELPAEEPWLHGVWLSNANVLTDDDPDLCDPAFGSWPHFQLCKIYKVTDPRHLEEIGA